MQPSPGAAAVPTGVAGASATPADPVPTEPTAADPPASARQDSAPNPAQAAGPSAAIVRSGGQGLEWDCPTCGLANPIIEDRCTGCAASFAQSLKGGSEGPPRVTIGALLASCLIPGMGHVAVGQTGTGVARAVLFCLWAAGGALLLGAGAGAGPAAAPLLLGAFVLWVGSIVDLLGLPYGARPLLGGRMLLWVVVAVVILALLGGFVAAGSVTSAADGSAA
ncbi:hypothetical protein ER308_00340 [Egibacter rhizosphaerae]|uniref:RanBP2-type domain-containing protein n=1 Tax=Egibacter rhizosphaerae TaxID=1670831 RepID=A0A411YAE1_9ACTN|nr:hypothetical protein [Egibacter rhizosphaerae]QBI18171.1 hypothetical protein ER308_00340 [Egibacter rhizosphaerae]